MLTRTQVNNIVKTLPEEFRIDELVEKLVFMDKVEKGMRQSESENVNTKEQAKQKLSLVQRSL